MQYLGLLDVLLQRREPEAQAIEELVGDIELLDAIKTCLQYGGPRSKEKVISL